MIQRKTKTYAKTYDFLSKKYAKLQGLLEKEEYAALKALLEKEEYAALKGLLEKEDYVFIDLDGTFVHEEITYHYSMKEIKSKPWKIVPYIYQYYKNPFETKMNIGMHIAKLLDQDSNNLYNRSESRSESISKNISEEISYIKAYKSPYFTVRQNLLDILTQNTKLKKILITGSNELLGKSIANQFPELFTDVIGSYGKTKENCLSKYENCIGVEKLKHMYKYTSKPFYIGNSMQDLPIFQALQKGCCITTNKKVIKLLSKNILHINE